MKTPPFPPSERERQAVLDGLRILDTPREDRFDRLTRLAARVLDVPITAVSLIDRDRQWFKSIEGLEVDETSRDVSFCGHTILSDRALVVEDATTDERFEDNPLVMGAPGIRFYAGQPLRIDSRRVGALCVIDRKPRKFTAAQLDALGDIRDLVERELQLDELNELRDRVERIERRRRRVERELENFFSLPVALLCVTGAGGRFTRVSAAWSTMLGWRDDELLGRLFIDVVHPEDRAATLAAIRRATDSHETDGFKNRCLHRDGTCRWLMWNVISPGRDGRTYATATDITELERMQSLKDEFVSTVSHELRTPLTSIRGAVDLLAAGVAGELPAQATTLMQIAHNNCERLSLIIDDLLDVEKIEAGKLHFAIDRHPAVALVEEGIRNNAQYASDRDIRFALVASIPETEVRVDADRLQQVLSNLLSNAAKYEPRGGTVEVAITREAEFVRVAVRDHGPGIPLEFRPRVFEKFAQADGSDGRESGGTGLGLSIAKAIVEQMGGEIGFTTSRGEGTTFHFTLPCAGAAVP